MKKLKITLHCLNCDDVYKLIAFEIRKIKCPKCNSKEGVIVDFLEISHNG